MSDPWSRKVRLHELARGPIDLQLEPSAQERSQIARDLGLESLPELRATLKIRPWLDGAELTGRFRAVVEQLCSISLDAFEQSVDGDIEVRVAPAGSPAAQSEVVHELDLDPDAPDPPDVLEGDTIDVAAYVVEHLALALDPFPRKPGATFDYEPPDEVESPFAALKKLQEPKP
jgi:uncharacterized metal-binding protein YceD (DUF177 family)